MSRKAKGKKLDADLDVELEEYEPSDSEDDYSEDEKLLLENVRKRPRVFDDESEEEVLGIASEGDDSDDDEGDDMASDLDGERDDDLPDEKAWGRKKKNFYNTDYVDDDYGGFQQEEQEAAARLEEEEARRIQRRLAAALRDDDFGLSAFLAKEEAGDARREGEQEVVAPDLAKLSHRQRLALVRKEAPEFFALTRDFSEKMAVLREELEPVVRLVRARKIPDCPAADFVCTVQRLLLNYCSNVCFYLLLKAVRAPVAAHPVVGRLARYRRLMAQADAVYREAVRPQLAGVLAADWDAPPAAAAGLPEEKQKQRKRKPLRLLSAPVADDGMSDESGADREVIPAPQKRRKRVAEEPEGAAGAPTAAVPARLPPSAPAGSSASSTGEDSVDEEVAGGEIGEEGERRAITYEMAKNKGLTPYRKKEMRNPRVRHRRKFEKARVRRKGQVREARKEVKKYGGEVSGIKIGVTKSIKLKV